MKTARLSVALTFAVFLCSCIGSVIPKSPPLQYYQLDYTYKKVDVYSDKFRDKIIRVWHFNAISPFNGSEMVVEIDKSGLATSRYHQWIDQPGVLLSEWIRKDIDRDGMFAGAYETVEVGKEIDVELSGVVERWSLVKTDNGYVAMMEVTITVWQKKPKASIIFKKHYSLKSDPLPNKDPETFALTMSKVVAELSSQFRKEFYDTIAHKF